MKHNLNDIHRILHILDAISNIEDFIKDVTLEEFLINKEKIAAVERMIEIIGEATNHLSEEIIHNPRSSTPWQKIISNRNILAHEYFKIDNKIIYQIATKEIIPLKQEIENILKDLEK